MGFKKVKLRIVECLKGQRVHHDVSRLGNINEKNLFLVGEISSEEVIDLLNRTKGHEYIKSQHHWDKSLEVHIFKPRKENVKWYIKCYFIEPNVWFISVHR